MSVKIEQTHLPENSLLKSNLEFVLIDAYRASFENNPNKTDITEIAKLFFRSSPQWIERLFELRNKTVQFLGLKTTKITERENQLNDFNCNIGEQIGLFKVFEKSENEVVLGEDDKHLNFRVSLFLENDNNDIDRKNLTISTSVKFNNWFGKLYFIPVKPFHRIIVPTMLKEIIKNIAKNQ